MAPEEQRDRDHSDVDATTQALHPPEGGGKVIGRYRLLQKIGEGGMGEVWLAEQKEPVRRRVALKLVKPGMNSREVVARLESERQALALMDHPAIAKVFDAGATAEDVPYFVMEYVAGSPITEYCDSHRLTLRERLDLFVRVCEGVQHAHQKAIIHRDLKPSNILVTSVDGRAVPKIIDFGVAKALTQRLTSSTMFTRLGSVIGTPEYMSPEQARSSGEDIDTRTDVYSLGIIFYELIAGAPPLDLRNLTFEEFLRRLRDQDPVKPSTRIRTHDAAASTEVCQKRQTEPRTLVSLIRGDLDAIALKALEKDRARRYGSAEQFSEDIVRYLDGRPVAARPATFVYRAGKLVRRHRWSVAAVLAVLLSLIGGLIAEQREARLAADRFDLVRGLAHKLIFDVGNEVARLPGSTRSREILVGAAVDYLDKLSKTAGDDPALLAELAEGYIQVGRAQGMPAEPNLGRPKDAEASFRKAIALCERAARLDPAHRLELAEANQRMSTLAALTGDPAGAREYARKGMDLAEALNHDRPGNVKLLTLLAVSNATLGDRLESVDAAAALAAYRKTKSYQTELLQLEPTAQNRIRMVRANVLVGTATSKLSQLDESAAALAEAESRMLQLLAEEPRNPQFQRQMALTYQSLSFLYETPEFPSLGDTPKAVDYARKYVAMQQAQVDADPNDANGEFGLSMALLCQTRAQRKIDPHGSLESAKKALDLIQKNLSRSPNSPLVIARRARILIQLGRAYLGVNDRKAALQAASEGLRQQRQVAAAESQDTDEQRVLLWALLGAAEATTQHDESLRLLQEASQTAENLLQRKPIQLPIAIPSSQVFTALGTYERNARLWKEIPLDTPWLKERRREAERLLPR